MTSSSWVLGYIMGLKRCAVCSCVYIGKGRITQQRRGRSSVVILVEKWVVDPQSKWKFGMRMAKSPWSELLVRESWLRTRRTQPAEALFQEQHNFSPIDHHRTDYGFFASENTPSRRSFISSNIPGYCWIIFRQAQRFKGCYGKRLDTSRISTPSLSDFVSK